MDTQVVLNVLPSTIKWLCSIPVPGSLESGVRIHWRKGKATGEVLFHLSKTAEEPTILLTVCKDSYPSNPTDDLVF